MKIPKPKPAILIVDDDFDVREVMADLLQDEGFEVRSAQTGQDALFEMRARPVKLVLLDLSMPAMDGQTFRAAQRADPAIAGVPIVVVSGAENYAAVATSLGAVAAFKKPFSIDEILDYIERYR